MADRVRAFLAIQPPADVRARLSQMLTEVEIDGARLRAVEKENIHLTVEFLGSTPEELIQPLERLIDEIGVGTRPFELEVVGISAFPSKRPVVIAAELAPTNALSHLVANVRKEVERIGFQSETRPFQPHITVARIKGGRNRVRGFSLATDQTFKADTLILFKSELSRAGARYTQLHSARFKG